MRDTTEIGDSAMVARWFSTLLGVSPYPILMNMFSVSLSPMYMAAAWAIVSLRLEPFGGVGTTKTSFKFHWVVSFCSSISCWLRSGEILNWITPVCLAFSSNLMTFIRDIPSFSEIFCWVMFSI